MCCEGFGAIIPTASTPVRFDVHVLREISRPSAPKHKRLPCYCSTSMCCERFRFRECLKAQAFIPIPFDVNFVATSLESVYPDLFRHLCLYALGELSKQSALTPVLFGITCCETFRNRQSQTVRPDTVRHLQAFTPILFDLYEHVPRT